MNHSTLFHPSPLIRYVDAQELFNQASQAADECFERAQRAAEEALRLLTKANMPLSPIDVNSLLDAANDISYRVSHCMYSQTHLSGSLSIKVICIVSL